MARHTLANPGGGPDVEISKGVHPMRCRRGARSHCRRRVGTAVVATRRPCRRRPWPTARAACASDMQKLCAGVPSGGGRIIACLKQHQAEVSDGCKQAIVKAMLDPRVTLDPGRLPRPRHPCQSPVRRGRPCQSPARPRPPAPHLHRPRLPLRERERSQAVPFGLLPASEEGADHGQ